MRLVFESIGAREICFDQVDLMEVYPREDRMAEIRTFKGRDEPLRVQ